MFFLANIDQALANIPAATDFWIGNDRLNLHIARGRIHLRTDRGDFTVKYLILVRIAAGVDHLTNG